MIELTGDIISLVARELYKNLTNPVFVPGHNENKSNALLSCLLGQWRLSCSALYMSTKSAIPTGHFSFAFPPLELQSTYPHVSNNLLNH